VPILVGFVVLAGACGSGPSTMVAPRATAAPTNTVFRQPGDPTYEICSEGAITKIDGQLTAGRVVGTPARAATTTSTTCTYRLSTGSLRMQVEEASSRDAARVTFTRHLRAAGPVSDVANLGDAAFSDRVGTTVTLKGPIVLTVDVSKVPSGNDRVQVAQSLSFQVLTTFNG
jgi:hypothetical protein